MKYKKITRYFFESDLYKLNKDYDESIEDLISFVILDQKYKYFMITKTDYEFELIMGEKFIKIILFIEIYDLKELTNPILN